MLKFIQRKINKYIVEQINPDFEFAFMGLNGMTIEQELDMDIKKLSNFATLNETRQKYDLPPIKDYGDIVENSIFWQAMQAKQNQEQQQQMQQQQMQMGANGDEEDYDEYDEDENEQENPFDAYDEEEGSEEDEEDNDDENSDSEEKAESNIFVKAFDNFLKQEEQEFNDKE